jgi:predicted amidohydrolase YtcJ
MEADIAVWDNNMYTFPSAEPRNLKCLMTIYPARSFTKASDALNSKHAVPLWL